MQKGLCGWRKTRPEVDLGSTLTQRGVRERGRREEERERERASTHDHPVCIDPLLTPCDPSIASGTLSFVNSIHKCRPTSRTRKNNVFARVTLTDRFLLFSLFLFYTIFANSSEGFLGLVKRSAEMAPSHARASRTVVASGGERWAASWEQTLTLGGSRFFQLIGNVDW